MQSRFQPFLAIALLVAVSSAAAAPGEGLKPYSDIEKRPLKALSQDEISGLRSGQGLGMALTAELNGYPGPRHVLDLSDRLGLSPDQVAKTEHLFREMQTAARALGHRIIMAETALEGRFGDGTIDSASLDRLTTDIGILRGQLRGVHLSYHLSMVAVMKPDQIAKYNRLRGYSGPAKAGKHHGPGAH